MDDPPATISQVRGIKGTGGGVVAKKIMPGKRFTIISWNIATCMQGSLSMKDLLLSNVRAAEGRGQEIALG